MNYQDRELLDQLAGEYVVGTLRGRVRRRFERVCADNPQAQQAVRRWEDRLLGLLSEVAAVQPAPKVWSGIEQRLNGAGSERTQGSLSLWSWLFGHWSRAALAGIAALSIGIGVYLQTAGVPTQPIGVFALEQGADIWRVSSTRDGGTLVIEAAEGVTPDAEHSYELWALPEGGAPVSLGLLPQSGRARLALNDAQRAALRGASKIAVSLEPVGGSPNGSPTTVLHVTDVSRLG